MRLHFLNLFIFNFYNLSVHLVAKILSLVYLLPRNLSDTSHMRSHTTSLGPLILHLPGGAESAGPPFQRWASDPLSIRGLNARWVISPFGHISFLNLMILKGLMTIERKNKMFLNFNLLSLL